MSKESTRIVRTFSIHRETDALIRKIAESKKWKISLVIDEAIDFYVKNHCYPNVGTEEAPHA
jgi:hypothetical protein